jgi:hypothetical protein
MPLAKGLILLIYFSITCGVLTAVNAALLQKVGGVSEGALSVVAALALAFFETLGLWELIDRFAIRSSRSAQSTTAHSDKAESALPPTPTEACKAGKQANEKASTSTNQDLPAPGTN